MLTMQDALLALTRYWAHHGCLIMQPFNTEVGAGTANPSTFLRVLGPEPWKVAYVEPSVRPDDSRYGQNPNRLQTHTQFQVIVKPEPGDAQDLYLGSLKALGIDPGVHDVRFVEDNWAQPAIGAWGLGWEVWLDGLEITQFTYFQQVGGQSLDPVPVELTYGIERIVMALQGVSHVKDIAFAGEVTYGEVFGQAEYEMSAYYLDAADVDFNRGLFDAYASEADRLIAAGLPVPAYSYVLKCSHAFNVLDARGAISTTERAKAFARMRTLARSVAQLWLTRREELGFPLGRAPSAVGVVPADGEPLLAPAPTADLASPSTLLFEIGTEELPPREVTATVEAVRASVTTKLDATRLPRGAVHTYGTPRRIVVLVDNVGPREPDAERMIKGPKTAVAYDDEGRPTPALEGFAKAQAVAIDELATMEIGGTPHLVNFVADTGRPAVDVLSGLLADVVRELRAAKNMRWDDPELSFSRPIRWLTALLGEVVVPVTVSRLTSGRRTHVHRTADEPIVTVPGAADYLQFLGKHGIVASAADRRSMIIAAAHALAAEAGGVVDVYADDALIDEIANLVEEPTAILGRFDRRYLELPDSVLTTVMREHQRYLPVRVPASGDEQAAGGELMPFFIAVANGACDRDLVRAGNEGVLAARYEDAAFFWRSDLAVPPQTFRSDISKLTFEERLGTMAGRADRIADVAHQLADIGDDDAAVLRRAGELAKFDLAAQMVVELSSLAGTMAREYALRAGEPDAVAAALYEMELPRHFADAVPEAVPGALLALADRFDLLAGLFAIGTKVTGSSDPFGMRRAALGVVRILRSSVGASLGVTVLGGLEAAASRLREQGVEVSPAAVADARELIAARFAQQLRDEGMPHELVTAVRPGADAPAAASRAAAWLHERGTLQEFADLVTAVQRIARIVPADAAASYDAALLTEPAERRLVEVVADLGDWSGRELGEFADAARGLTEPVNAFFDDVLVNADDPDLRAARLGLLATILAHLPAAIDWSAVGASR